MADTSSTGIGASRVATPTSGVGLKYNHTKNVAARLEFQRYNDVGDNATTGQSDVNVASLGLRIKF